MCQTTLNEKPIIVIPEINDGNEIVIPHTAEDPPEKKNLTAWVKNHKVQLMLAGVCVSSLLVTIITIKNKETINELWCALRKRIEKGAVFSLKWFEKASLEELYEARSPLQEVLMNPEYDDNFREECRRLILAIDKYISKIEWQGVEHIPPVPREHGWYLPNDD